jgi:hypothetical protein
VALTPNNSNGSSAVRAAALVRRLDGYRIVFEVIGAAGTCRFILNEHCGAIPCDAVGKGRVDQVIYRATLSIISDLMGAACINCFHKNEGRSV